MGKYLKKFSTHQEYEQYINSSDAILPNVSICTTEGDVHYNPFVETRVVAKYNVTVTSSQIQLCTDTRVFSDMEIDGVKQTSVVSRYTFSTTGEHTVEYTLTDPTSIGDWAFMACSGLTSIDIPDSVTSIGDWAFQGCNNLTSIDIPDSVTSIGERTFMACSGLTSIDIPDSVTSIGNNAFSNCSSLTSCTIGSGVTSIGNGAFTYCSGLTSVTVDSNNTVYDSRNNCNAIIETSTNTLIIGSNNTVILDSVTSIGEGAFLGRNSLTSIVIPDSVTSIGNNAFRECYGFTSCTIGSGVTSIGDYVFAYCRSLTSIVSNATTAPTIQSGTLRDVKTSGTLTVPSGSTGYDVWMQNANYYLGKYNWTKVEQ